jgi:hypothetical protein
MTDLSRLVRGLALTIVPVLACCATPEDAGFTCELGLRCRPARVYDEAVAALEAVCRREPGRRFVSVEEVASDQLLWVPSSDDTAPREVARFDSAAAEVVRRLVAHGFVFAWEAAAREPAELHVFLRDRVDPSLARGALDVLLVDQRVHRVLLHRELPW